MNDSRATGQSISTLHAARGRGGKRLRFVAAGLFVLLIGWLVAAPDLAKNLIVEKPLAHADAIVVLGGSATYLERTNLAAELYKQGVARKIFLTDDGTRGGWSRLEQRNIPFVELARRNLISNGVPAENIEIQKPATSGTIYEAKSFADIAGRENLNSVLLVTSAYHTSRALRTFEREFAAENLPVEIGVESAQTGWQTPPPAAWWFSAFGWQSVAGEYVKSVYYWAFY